VLLPLALFLLVQLASGADVRWESHVAHFWLVLSAALVTLGLGYAVSVTARRRRDARLFLISLAFMASFGFLALHALATPEVLLGKNAGFELATPVGLVVAGALAAISAVEMSQARGSCDAAVADADRRPPVCSRSGASSRSPRRGRSTGRSRPSSSTAGSSRSPPRGSRSSAPPRSATSGSTVAGAPRSCSRSRWRSSSSPRPWS
jgi:hypothetical protein